MISTFTAAILEVLFGYTAADDGDEIMTIVEDALEWIGEAFTPGKYLIETLPILQYVPPWFPGATVQKLIVYWRSTVTRLKEVPFQRVKEAMVSCRSQSVWAARITDLQFCFQDRNEAPDCVVTKLIARMAKDGDEQSAKEAEDTIKNVATVTIEGNTL